EIGFKSIYIADNKTNPDTKQNKDESEENEEEVYETVEIPKPSKPTPDLNEPTKPSTEQTARREHKEEDYMTVKIPTPTKTESNAFVEYPQKNEKQDIKPEKIQDDDDSANMPTVKKRPDKAKTEVEEEDV
ncbi:hypothetical protein MAR_005112, partial [Mya arenaria]